MEHNSKIINYKIENNLTLKNANVNMSSLSTENRIKLNILPPIETYKIYKGNKIGDKRHYKTTNNIVEVYTTIDELIKIWDYVSVRNGENIQVYHYEKDKSYKYQLPYFVWILVKDFMGIYKIKNNHFEKLYKIPKWKFEIFNHSFYNIRWSKKTKNNGYKMGAIIKGKRFKTPNKDTMEVLNFLCNDTSEDLQIDTFAIMIDDERYTDLFKWDYGLYGTFNYCYITKLNEKSVKICNVISLYEEIGYGNLSVNDILGVVKINNVNVSTPYTSYKIYIKSLLQVKYDYNDKVVNERTRKGNLITEYNCPQIIKNSYITKKEVYNRNNYNLSIPINTFKYKVVIMEVASMGQRLTEFYTLMMNKAETYIQTNNNYVEYDI